MKDSDMRLWRQLSKFTQGIILIMVSVLFFGWGVMGAQQVDNQTREILQGVHDDLEQTTAIIVKNQAILLAESKYVTCILTTLPEKRRPKNIHRCSQESGLNDLREGVKP